MGADWEEIIVFQIAISNPNREVLMTLSKAGLVDLIGKEWYFVRVHDAVQVCLQHVNSVNESPKSANSPLDSGKPSFLKRLLKQRGEDFLSSQLEAGQRTDAAAPAQSGDDHLEEPLLAKKQ